MVFHSTVRSMQKRCVLLGFAWAFCQARFKGFCRGRNHYRSFEILACGGFILHERTPELLEHYEEGREIACFGSIEELTDKITHYLTHAEERQAMASAGHMTKILEYHAKRGENGRGSSSGIHN